MFKQYNYLIHDIDIRQRRISATSLLKQKDYVDFNLFLPLITITNYIS